MKQTTVRDLRYNFPRVERLLADGESVEITKRRRVVARLVPVEDKKPPIPDFGARAAKIFGKKTLPVSGAELVRLDRDRGF
jgi:antitoxin (DNA-binding transcriptional repressor) of toxin-antitoxin stability system